MFELIRIGGPYSDCTSSYDVKFDKPYTVEEFINEVISDKREWGHIGIYSPDSVFGYPRCEYRYGEILESSFDEEFLQLEINNVRASGGWSCMDYVINFDFEKEKTMMQLAKEAYMKKLRQKREEERIRHRTVDISPVVEPLTLPIRKQR